MDNKIITISREYGSGGRSIGEQLAKELGVPYYDRQIIHMAAEKSGMSPDYIERTDESISNPFLQNLPFSGNVTEDALVYYDTPMTDKVFLAQSEVIREIAAQGSCVIVGRCASYVLRESTELFRIFVRARTADRLQRAVDQYGLSSEGAMERVRKIDKNRINYYKYYTNRQWGNIDNYDLVINSSFTGTEGAVKVIKAMMNEGDIWKNR